MRCQDHHKFWRVMLATVTQIVEIDQLLSLEHYFSVELTARVAVYTFVIYTNIILSSKEYIYSY